MHGVTDKLATDLWESDNSWIGSNILVALNLGAEFNAEEAEEYRIEVLRQSNERPHLYTLAARCYYQALSNDKVQSIILNGESGAGKSEAAKLMLKFFDNGKHNKQSILPLLQAYGNAKVKTNPNSSRFGLWVQLDFSKGAKNFLIENCLVQTFLLEKCRIISRPQGESNFHIVCQMQDASRAIDRICKHWKTLHEAMQNLHFTTKEQAILLDIINALLYLIDVEFAQDEEQLLYTDDSISVESCRITNSAGTLRLAASLLGLKHDEDYKLLANLLTKHKSASLAQGMRDGLVKFLYSELFDWLVQHMNHSFSNENNNDSIKSQIGILDIFGFDRRATLEQLCINYANERILQFFMHNTFSQDLQAQEEIPYVPMPFQDNSSCISLFENNSVSLFSILDDECLRGLAPRDHKYHNKICQVFAPSSSEKHSDYFVVKNMKNVRYGFGIKHFAGVVEYDARGFVQTNRDNTFSTSMPLVSLFQSRCKLEIVKNFFSKHHRKENITMCTQFTSQIDVLLQQILKPTQPHFLFCIKSNKVLDQMRSFRLIEAIELQRAGYSLHVSLSSFARRYALIVPIALRDLRRQRYCRKDNTLRTICKNILADPRVQEILHEEIGIAECCIVGKTRVFFKDLSTRHVLECLRIEAASILLTKAQARFRGSKIRNARSGTLLARARARYLAHRFAWARLFLQRWSRGALTRKLLVRYRTAYEELLKLHKTDMDDQVLESLLDDILIPLFGTERDGGRSPKKRANLLLANSRCTIGLPEQVRFKINQAIQDLRSVRSRRVLLESVTHVSDAMEFKSLLSNISALGLEDTPQVKWAQARFGKFIDRFDLLDDFKFFLQDPVAGAHKMNNLFTEADHLGLSSDDIVQQAREECQRLGGLSILDARAALRSAVENVNANQITTCLIKLCSESENFSTQEIESWPEVRAAHAMQRMLEFESIASNPNQQRFVLTDNLIQLCARIEAASNDSNSQRIAEAALRHATSSELVFDQVSRAYKWRVLFCEWLYDTTFDNDRTNTFCGMCINEARQAYHTSGLIGPISSIKTASHSSSFLESPEQERLYSRSRPNTPSKSEYAAGFS